MLQIYITCFVMIKKNEHNIQKMLHYFDRKLLLFFCECCKIVNKVIVGIVCTAMNYQFCNERISMPGLVLLLCVYFLLLGG